MNIVVIAPHPDDESIGCGGAVRLHVEKGDTVHAIFLSSGELGLKEMAPDQAWAVREKEARRACQVLGIASLQFLRLPDWMMGDDVAGAAAKLGPALLGLKGSPDVAVDRVYLPHPREWHPDHKAALPILGAAWPATGLPAPQLRGYEVWTPMAEHQHVEDITPVMACKLRALRRHRSQTASWPYVRAVRGLNEFRGAMSGRCRYAEVFQDLLLPG